MDRQKLLQILNQISEEKLRPQKALEKIEDLTYSDLSFAKIDHARKVRKGFPEVVFGEYKTVEQLFKICCRHLEVHDKLLITRISEEKYEKLQKLNLKGKYNPIAKTLVFDYAPSNDPVGDILILTAGTADLPVAEEAKETALVMGNRVDIIADVGVAGLHRLLDCLERLNRARVLIVIAGMEGALASVIGGLVPIPIIAVPTSIGYGASFNGITALLSMLNTCASGVTTVNIDNGFGAAYAASLINQPYHNKNYLSEC